MRISGFGFRVSVFGFRDSGFGFRDSGFSIRVSGFGIRDLGFVFRVSCFGSRVSGEPGGSGGRLPAASSPRRSFRVDLGTSLSALVQDELKRPSTAVFLSGLNQMNCTNGHLKPDFFEFVFQVPGGGQGGGGPVEVRGMGGRHAGRRGLKNWANKKVKQKVLKFPAS